MLFRRVSGWFRRAAEPEPLPWVTSLAPDAPFVPVEARRVRAGTWRFRGRDVPVYLEQVPRAEFLPDDRRNEQRRLGEGGLLGRAVDR